MLRIITPERESRAAECGPTTIVFSQPLKPCRWQAELEPVTEADEQATGGGGFPPPVCRLAGDLILAATLPDGSVVYFEGRCRLHATAMLKTFEDTLAACGRGGTIVRVREYILVAAGS